MLRLRCLVLLLLAVLLAGCNESGSPGTGIANDGGSSPTQVEGGSGVSIEVLQGWKVRKDDLGIRVYVYGESLHDEYACEPQEEHVAFRVEALPTQWPGRPYGERPASFGPTSGTGWTSGFEDQYCNSKGQGVRFREGGRWVDIDISAASKAEASRIAQVYEMLDSLVVAPGRA